MNSILCGGIFFDEFQYLTPHERAMFSVGVVICIIGIGVIVSTPNK